MRWLREFRDERFLAWIHFFDPHGPYRPPAPYLDLVPREIELPDAVRSAWGDRAEGIVQRRRAYRGEVA